jgi:hypothetical protein
MVCSDHPVFGECGWQDGVNCFTHRFGDLESFAEVARGAVADGPRVQQVQRASLANAARFAHAAVADGLYEQLRLLWSGKVDEARNYWSVSPTA